MLYFKSKENRSPCYSLISVDDETEIIFSQTDFNYVLNLVNKYDTQLTKLNVNNKSSNKIKLVNEYRYSKLVRIKTKNRLKELIKKYIYVWNDDFKFTSRFINIISVSTVTLYYFVLTIFYFYTIYSEQMINLYTFVASQFEILQLILDKIIIISYLRKIVWIPIFVSGFFCFIQLLLLVIETKTYLIEIYKGKCDFISNKKMSKNKVGIMSLSFGGYLVGFLIWGYIILYFFILIIGVLIYIIDNFVTFGFLFNKLYKYGIQVLAVYIIKFLLKRILLYSFVENDSKILALNNFRAYNIVLYFVFFFDLFFGFLNAIVRLLKGILASALMMSSKLFIFFPIHNNNL